MSLRLSPMTLDELEQWTKNELETLGTTTTADISSQLREELDQFMLPVNEVFFLKITDDASGQIIACAKWHVYSHECTEFELRERLNEAKTMTLPDNNDLVDLIVNRRATYMGTRPHLLLTNLKTRREHQGRGAATMLMAWGTDKADGEGLEVYLEAAEQVAPFYLKFGFERVGEIIVGGDADADRRRIVKFLVRQPRSNVYGEAEFERGTQKRL